MAAVPQKAIFHIDLDGKTAERYGKNDLYEGDKNANEIHIYIYRQHQLQTLDGYTVTGEMQRSDGAIVPCDGEIIGSVAKVTLNEHCYNKAGDYMLSIKLSRSSENVTRTILRIYGQVQRQAAGPYIDVDESLVDVEAILELYAEMKSTTDAVQAATTNAKEAASQAEAAAQQAETAASAAEKWGAVTAEASTVSAEQGATARLITENDSKKFVFGIPKGEMGLPFLIKGDAFPTLAALQAGVTNPEVGDQYNVGTSAPYNVYRWTGSKWENQGQIGSAAIDATLTQSGQAADAKAAGEALEQKLDLSGGTLSGNLIISNDNYRYLRLKRNLNNQMQEAQMAIEYSKAIKIAKKVDDVETNHISLKDDSTVLGKPLALDSGGTGATTAREAEYNICKDMNESTSATNDASLFVCKLNASASKTNGVLTYKKGSDIWTWIASKIRSVFGFTQGGVLPAANGGTGKTSLSELRSALGVSAVEFTNSVTFNTPKNFANFRCMGEMAFVQYQSQSANVKVGTVLFTLPETGFRPAERYTTVPFVVDGTAYGRALIDNTTGECKVTHISSAATGVVAINMTYYASRILEV